MYWGVIFLHFMNKYITYVSLSLLSISLIGCSANKKKAYNEEVMGKEVSPKASSFSNETVKSLSKDENRS